jgi:dTDP-4-amino-4,6-dideoxygalactose transaminase
MIPFAHPLAAYHHYRAEIDEVIQRVMNSGRYILGPEVEAFEAEFAEQMGARFAVGVASGTEALWLALRAVGIAAGDEVITPSLTASATVAAIVESGAVPVFAEVRDSDLNIDSVPLEKLLTPRTRAIVAVHLYGNPADLTALTAFAQAHNLRLIEDCAQAHGAQHAGRPVGTFGDIAAWSFYPTKNLGAFGDGGIVTTQRVEAAERLRLLREYGWRVRYDSSEQGWNSRLDEIHAAMLRVRLKHLAEDNHRRREIAKQYRAALPSPLHGPVASDSNVGVEHLFVIRHRQRDKLQAELKQAGIGTAIHYPVPCHLQGAYVGFGRGPNSLPITERAAREILSLPMYPELSPAEVEQVITGLLKVSKSLQ